MLNLLKNEYSFLCYISISQVNQMVELGISQSKASTVMSIFGAFEIISRVITSYVGDYLKGKLLHVYVLFSFLLCLLNIGGAFAYTYTHMIVYGIGKLTFLFSNTTLEF